MVRIAAIAAVALLPLLVASSAFAHAEPIRANPGDGAVLTSPPGEIVLEMSQDMARQAGGNDIDVFDAAGNEVTTVAAAIDNGNRRVLRVTMPATLEPGVYTVRWKTLSDEDGDDDSGELSFEYDPDGTPSEGLVELREDVATPGPTSAPPSSLQPVAFGSEDRGMSWVLVAAVGAGAFVLGAGVSYVLIQKRP